MQAHDEHDGVGDLDDAFESSLFVSGGAGSPRQEAFHGGASPAGSPARGSALELLESPPPSPPRRVLTRVSSVGMDIPATVDAEESVRSPLVGPSPVPAAHDASADDAAAAQPLAAGDEPRKLGPSDFTILSLVGQGAFGKVRRRAAGASRQRTGYSAVACGSAQLARRRQLCRLPQHTCRLLSRRGASRRCFRCRSATTGACWR
jgi:hypothetical protein